MNYYIINVFLVLKKIQNLKIKFKKHLILYKFKHIIPIRKYYIVMIEARDSIVILWRKAL